MPMLEVKDLEVYYGMIQAIKGISFQVDEMCIRDSIASYGLYSAGIWCMLKAVLLSLIHI